MKSKKKQNQMKKFKYTGLSGFTIEHTGDRSEDIKFVEGGNHFFAAMLPNIEMGVALKTAVLIQYSPELLVQVEKLTDQINKCTKFIESVPHKQYGINYAICIENALLVGNSTYLLKTICKG